LEAIQVYYDPQKVTYEKLLDVFWRHIDPDRRRRSVCGPGNQYASSVFYHDEEQKIAAEKSKEELANRGIRQPIVTQS